MINTQVRIHDKFSVEFKIGFVTENEVQDENEFRINTWIFIPNGLDINHATYTKDQFYADVKSNMRLITPVFSLTDIQMGIGPFPRLHRAVEKLLFAPDDSNTENYVYQTKMLLCILKSALRETSAEIGRYKEEPEMLALVDSYINDIKKIIAEYRAIRDKLLKSEALTSKQKEYFLFGDEFLGNIVELTTYQVMRKLSGKSYYGEVKPRLMRLAEGENENRRLMGYNVPSEHDEELNSLILIKRNILKKFVESDLYLQTVKKKDAVFVREFYYSLAAGIAMFFATIISFFATQRFGNFTTSLFFALVLSYMMKDRIKEMSRAYFSSKLDRRYFDRKWKLSIRNQEIGWIKEGFDFMEEQKVPAKIMSLRNKSSLVEAENKIYDEKIILFRKLVSLSKKEIEKYKEYRLSGINDVIRLNLTSFIKKMDNPLIPVFLPDDETGFKTIMGNRVYALYFVLQCESDNDAYYKKYRLLFNRNGISDVSELDEIDAE
ncbi:hypothetical protein D0T49_05930 [Paludibacter sp. 221]|uniref:hypothetical protein n=1 Tax=Paludibacter sp. 221 TaxID=2302939 RepID=UPI0013D426BC|nr:hypothetical protein [Paludibacter sp. 221]NDV46581.1 hypothetical protein [Paludibacter sp. 221]